MIEPERPLKRKDQIMMDAEIAKNLEAQLQAELEEEERLVRLKEEEINIDLNFDCPFVELTDKRKKFFARLRAEKIRSKPPTKAQKRNQINSDIVQQYSEVDRSICSYGYKETAKGSDKAVEGSEIAEECSSKRAADKLEQEDAKRPMIKENESAELKRCVEIIPKDYDDVTIKATPLSYKSPTIVDYKIYKDGRKSFFKIIRTDGQFCYGDLEVAFPLNTCYAEAISTACFTQNQSIIHTRYNKTPYELLHGRKPNVEYFHVFDSLCYPINDREDLEKMKPKATIRIFIGYLETYRGFRIYNRRTKKIMETIHIKFDELITMVSEHDNLATISQRFIHDDSSEESMNTSSKEDLDNLLRLMYKEYFEKRSSKVSVNSAAQQVHNQEDSPLTSSIIVEYHEAHPIMTTSDEQTSPISMNEVDELNQEDSADFDGHTVFVPYYDPNFKKPSPQQQL
nr:retrovirus-related Pol polyprotein from transposon TNT 1-94 [Tanacetum cinerariifolium]